jgi:hypothetical protein
MKAFAVYHPDCNNIVYIHAETRSKARYKVWRMVQEADCGYNWKIYELHSDHIKVLDDKPINSETLLGIASEEDRYFRGCKCEICKPRS